MKLKQNKQEEYNTYREKNTQDGYSNVVVEYSEAWATLMEEKIDNGEKLGDIADSTSHTADTQGITGFMYGCAVHALTHFWVYGDDLRKWHNKKYGVEESEEKVVNPAVLTVG